MFDPANSSTLELGTLLTGLGGGLALFLTGMRQMTDALKAVAGSRMRNLLAQLTANRFTAAFAGATVTAVIQSSSVTTVMVVGFISAGLMTMSQSIGVIIGANVGTTVTAQIIAFQVYKYGLAMIAVGFLMHVVFQRENVRQWGLVLMGLGLIFFGMELMSLATEPLRTWQPFIDWMQQMNHPLWGVLLGLVFTALVQSSSATTGVVIVLASQGLVTLESGIALILGANMGTCVTAMLSSLGRPREAVQAAVAHLVFNTLGVLLWLFFIPQLADLVRTISPSQENLAGTLQLAADTPRQIANAHTLFNVGNALLFIWFTGPMARLVDRIVPKRAAAVGMQPLYLEDYYLEQPDLALEQVRREIVRLAELAQAMLQRTLSVVTTGSPTEIASLARADDDVDALHGAIITYLGRLSQKNLVDPQPQQLYEYIAIANYLENLADIIETNLLDDARKRRKLGIAISRSTMAVLRPIHEKVCWAFDRALKGLRTGDKAAAHDATGSKRAVNDLADAATGHLAKRLVASEPNRLAAFQLETDLIENLKRINTLTRRVARILLQVESLSAHEQTSGESQPAAEDENGGQ
jgi:phosphate:Na+ symporter